MRKFLIKNQIKFYKYCENVIARCQDEESGDEEPGVLIRGAHSGFLLLSLLLLMIR
jgi:hypothetical protein